MTKTVLVSPPFGEEEIAGKTESMKSVLNIIPPLGLCYIAAVLEKNNYEVKIVEGQIDMTYSDVIKEVIKEKPDIVGFSMLTPMFKMVKNIATKVKKELPSTIIALGGSHITALPFDTLRHNCFGIGIIGEGEYTFLEFVKGYEKNGLKNLKKIDGLAYKNKR